MTISLCAAICIHNHSSSFVAFIQLPLSAKAPASPSLHRLHRSSHYIDLSASRHVKQQCDPVAFRKYYKLHIFAIHLITTYTGVHVASSFLRSTQISTWAYQAPNTSHYKLSLGGDDGGHYTQSRTKLTAAGKMNRVKSTGHQRWWPTGRWVVCLLTNYSHSLRRRANQQHGVRVAIKRQTSLESSAKMTTLLRERLWLLVYKWSSRVVVVELASYLHLFKKKPSNNVYNSLRLLMSRAPL